MLLRIKSDEKRCSATILPTPIIPFLPPISHLPGPLPLLHCPPISAMPLTLSSSSRTGLQAERTFLWARIWRPSVTASRPRRPGSRAGRPAPPSPSTESCSSAGRSAPREARSPWCSAAEVCGDHGVVTGGSLQYSRCHLIWKHFAYQMGAMI